MWELSGPLTNHQATGQILDPKKRYRRTGHECLENVVKFYQKVTDNITGHVKVQIFDRLSSLVSSGKVVIFRIKADKTAWIVSGIVLSALISTTNVFSMGAATGGGDASPGPKFWGRSPRNHDF